MDSLLDIESYLEFRKELSRLEGDIPYYGDMKDLNRRRKRRG